MRAVCKTWHSSVSLLDPSPCLPWLVPWNMREKEETLCYSLSSRKTYKIHCPQLRGACLQGMAGRFVLCYRRGPSKSLSLFNPLTGIEIPLPCPEDGCTFAVVSNPLQEDVVAVAGYTPDADEIWVALIRRGDQTWARHDLDINYQEGVCVYCDGFYYVNQYNQYEMPTQIVDATTGEVVTTVPPPDTGSYLIAYQNILETSGQILLIYRHETTGKLEDIAFGIYRLDQVRGHYQWAEVRSIGDRMLFLDNFVGFTLKSTDFPGYRGNCIYFQLQDDLEHRKPLLCWHDLENGTTKAMPNFCGKWGTWIIPNF
ncbi:F-box domain-containing protein [Rhynchospora pubera]|uniref:F-box domain-containing protein n=1 Tax=Rhynchospora pubera TaxID=906938 RepID=A0AAV8CU85_9POAL|nr:F-box domain-containing protein [Rhynchospora pubera]